MARFVDVAAPDFAAGSVAPYRLPGDTQRSPIPAAIADAVTVHFREQGATARMKWHPLMKCAVIELELSNEDPRMKAWFEGTVQSKPTECVILHEWNVSQKRYVAMDLDAMGAEKLVEWLQQADAMSGRGEFGDRHEAMQAVRDQNEALRQQQAAQVEEAARESAWLHRRSVFELPSVNVPAKIGGDSASTAE